MAVTQEMRDKYSHLVQLLGVGLESITSEVNCIVEGIEKERGALAIVREQSYLKDALWKFVLSKNTQGEDALWLVNDLNTRSLCLALYFHDDMCCMEVEKAPLSLLGKDARKLLGGLHDNRMNCLLAMQQIVRLEGERYEQE